MLKMQFNEVLDPQRSEDIGNGLWEVFNRVQENIMEGNFEYLTVKGSNLVKLELLKISSKIKI